MAETTQRSAKEVEKELERIERFRKVAGFRANRALDYIEALLRTSDRARYSYTTEQAEQIVSKLRQAVDQLEAGYYGKPSARLRVDL